LIQFLSFARRKRNPSFTVFIPTLHLHLVDESGLLLPIEHWNVLNLGHFLCPNSYTELNSRPSVCVGDVLPATTSIYQLADVVEDSVHSSHQRHGRDPICSTDFPDPAVDLDISLLPDQVRDYILTNQRPNHFLRSSELSHFDIATNIFDDEDEDEDNIACRYYIVGTKYLILIDGRFVNLYTDVQFKHFKISFPELKSNSWYNVIKWYDDFGAYCFLFGIVVPSYVNIVKNSDSSYGFTCGHSSTDSAPAFPASKLQGWGQTIYQGIAYTAFKSLPASSRMKSLLLNHHLLGYRLLHHILQRYHPLYNVDATDHIIERPQQQFYDNTVRRIVKLPMQEYFDAYDCFLVLDAYIYN